MRNIILALTLILAPSALYAQEPQLTLQQKQQIEKINLAQRVQELEKANAELRYQLLAIQIATEKEKLKQDIDATFPAYTWDDATGKFTPKEKKDGELR